jgi:hypothetical protein
MQTLLQDRFAPTTSAVGLLELPLADAERALADWREALDGAVRTTRVTGQLPQLLGHLEPLTSAIRPRELLVATRNPSWTAYLDCGLGGSDPEPVVAHLTRTVGCTGLVVSAVPHTIGTGLESPGRHGAVQLYLLGPLRTDFLNYVRTISVVHDGRWRFDAAGTVQDFEDPEQYQARRVRDRFTSELLSRYCEALGVRPLDEEFYLDAGVLLERPLPLPAAAVTMTLTEAQRHWGIVPGAASDVPG